MQEIIHGESTIKKTQTFGYMKFLKKLNIILLKTKQVWKRMIG